MRRIFSISSVIVRSWRNQLARLVGGNPAWASVDRDWHLRYRLADELGLEPVRRYGARHAPGRLRLPLVVPERLPADVDLVGVLKRLIEVAERDEDPFPRGATPQPTADLPASSP